MTELTGRRALVTGGTKGVGLAIAEQMVDQGIDVVFCSRTAADLDRVGESLAGRGGGRAIGLVCDVRDPSACDSLIQEAVDGLGGLDILVNNAGLGILKPIQELEVEEFQLLIETNLNGTFYCTKFAVPHLAAGGGGWVINIGSLAGRHAVAGGSGYNASKFGLRGLTEAAMEDLRFDNVRVSMIMPGSVDTEFAGNEVSEATAWKLQPGDVARAVLDLLRYPGNAMPSKVEMRPTVPPRR